MSKSSLKFSKKCERVINKDGTESLLLNDEAIKALKDQLKLFKKTFGRDPIGNEPIFFDPDVTDKPTAISKERMNELLVKQLESMNVPGNYIHTFKKTGRLVTEQNEHRLPDKE